MKKAPKEIAPNQRTVNGTEYLEYCRRAKAGEFHIAMVEVKRPGKYLLTLAAPITETRMEKPVRQTPPVAPVRVQTVDEQFKELFA